MPVPTSFADLDTNAANNSPPGTESAKGTIDDYLRTGFAFSKQLYNGLPAGGVGGLNGKVNATTPLTKFDLSADAVVLRNSTGGTVTRYNTGTFTCDLGLTGSIANGRDQSSAFTANSWINLFFIWNGTTLATIASTAAHTTGPTLPAGYTHWCYATTIRWNASSNIVPVTVRGSAVIYDASINLLTGAPAVSAETSISLSTVVPPNALISRVQMVGELGSTSAGPTAAWARMRYKSGSNPYMLRMHTGTANSADSAAGVFDMPNVSQTVYYFWSEDNASVSTRSIYIDVCGYAVPNGGER